MVTQLKQIAKTSRKDSWVLRSRRVHGYIPFTINQSGFTDKAN